MLGMEDSLGSLEEGKLADTVNFDAVSLAMLCGTHDSISANILHAGVRGVHTVNIDAIIRKFGGILLPSHY